MSDPAPPTIAPQVDDANERRTTCLIFTGVFLVAGIVGIFHHEMWRDELEIWLIARDSGSLGALLANMNTEGHPIVWYLLQFMVARFTAAPLAMQIVHVLIATVSVAVVLRFAPFTQLQRLLLCFGYYLGYEFSVISRAYGLQFLLLFLFCVLAARPRQRLLVLSGLLALAANTTLYGTIISLALGAGLAAVLWLERPQEGLPRHSGPALLIWLGGAFVGFGHVLYQSMRIGPAHADAHQVTWDAAWLLGGFSTVFRGFVPLANPVDGSWWNSSLLDTLPGGVGLVLGAVAGLALFGVAVWMLASRPILAAVFVAGSLPMLAITLFVWGGSQRHHGQIYLFFVVCCWLLLSVRKDPPPKRGLAFFLTGVFAIQCLAGVHAYAMDLTSTFSHAESVGHYLKQANLEDELLVGTVDYAAQPIAAFLDGPIYYPESRQFGTFLDWGPGRRLVSPREALDQAIELVLAEKRDVVMIFSYAPSATIVPTTTVAPGIVLEFDREFRGAVVPDENYFLFRLKRVETP